MALTVAREIALFEVLEVPITPTVNYIVGEGQLAESHDVSGSPKNVYDMIIARVAQLTGAYLTRLEELLDDWIDLGNDTMTLDGSVGSVQSVQDSVAGERDEIKKKVMVLVPFYRAHIEMRRGQSQVFLGR